MIQNISQRETTLVNLVDNQNTEKCHWVHTLIIQDIFMSYANIYYAGCMNTSLFKSISSIK